MLGSASQSSSPTFQTSDDIEKALVEMNDGAGAGIADGEELTQDFPEGGFQAWLTILGAYVYPR